jgi:glycerol-3-phosphate O-acyltransferase
MVTPHRSAMTERFGRLQRAIASRLTAHVHIDGDSVAEVRDLARRGTVVYVLRNRSLLDYFLVNWLMLREGLPVARFANGVSSALFQPLPQLMRRLLAALTRVRWRSRDVRARADRECVAELVASGEPVLVFLRARSPRLLFERRALLAAARPGGEYLHEVVRRSWGGDHPVYLVPVSFFRGRTFRRQASWFSALAYSVHDAPSDLKKLITYRFNREDLLFTFGRVINLVTFVSNHRSLGEARTSRRLTNRLQRDLAQEERAVWGPLLLPREVIAERVFEGPEVQARIAQVAREHGVAERRVWREARGYFREMSANFNGLSFAILEVAFREVWRRAFSGLEVRGLERVIECIKENPVVLVPCHRSHFDYLVLSYIFREHFLSPPHIAAGINLSFWPVSSLLRGGGAFFIRRSFDDNELYKLVFHRYLTTLISQGYTLEFFIEGGRSRTGKILTPKLGMLGGIVRAFLQGARRDLYLVPVSIHYGRIAEESAYNAELAGAPKQRESFSALLKARSVLKQRHGTVYVSFAEPLSLRDTLGDRLIRFTRDADEPEVQEEQRRFVQKLGFRILREVNEAAVVGATSLSATVLLSHHESSCPFPTFVLAARTLAELLRWKGAAFSPSLERNLVSENFAEILGFLASSGLIDIVEDEGTKLLEVRGEKRGALDFYKNNSIHSFVLPSLLAHAYLRRVSLADLKTELWWWLDLLRWEFALPERESVAAEIGRLLDYFRAHGAIFDREAQPVPLVLACAGILENFRETYWVAVRTLAQLDGEPIKESDAIERMMHRFEEVRRLGEVTKPEAASTVTFGNAISRLVEIGCIERKSKTGERDRWLARGPQFAELGPIERRLGASLRVVSAAPTPPLGSPEPRQLTNGAAFEPRPEHPA